MELLPEHERDSIIKKTSKLKRIFKNPMANIILFQTLGSLIFAYGICVTQQIPNPFWVFLISSFYFFALSISGFFSGGHINPIVTIGLYMAGRVEKKKLGVYFISQLLGTILGTVLYFVFFHQNPQIYSQTPAFREVVLDFVSEIVGTFIFVFGVQLVILLDYMKGEPFNYVFFSLMLLVARYFTFRKGCLNPATAIAFQIFAAVSNSNFGLFYPVLGLVAGQTIGALLSAAFFCKFYLPLLRQVEEGE